MDVERIKVLIAQREAIDIELVTLVTGGAAKARKPPQCSKCGSNDHTARNCDQQAT